ncbi:MAG: CZB domain-containing protein [Rhodospirillaceae bacterium]
MSFEQHDIFRNRLTASPLSAGERGITAMVLVEIVRWTQRASLCTKSVEELGELLRVPSSDMQSAVRTLEVLGVIEHFREGAAGRLRLKTMMATKPGEELRREITEAIHYHSIWKRRLRLAIDTGKTDIATEELGRDDQCEFGRWLRSPSFSEAERDGTYEAVCHLHTQFHRVAAATLQMALNGNKEEAERCMDVSGVYSRASRRLIRALSSWRRAVGK